MEQYFSHLGDQDCSHIYDMVISEVEPALFQTVLKHARGNQSRAAEILGLNRGTLRKKLKQYKIS
jgi:Fis family transcriptional regulator